MNVKRFVGKNAREAIALARATWGDDTLVLSNRPISGGVEILAMADTALHGPAVRAAPAPAAQQEPAGPMSTVSFEHFVRERQQRDAQQVLQPPPQKSLPLAPVEPVRFAAQALRAEEAAAAARAALAVPVAAVVAAPGAALCVAAVAMPAVSPAVSVPALSVAAASMAAPYTAAAQAAFTPVPLTAQGTELLDEIKSMRGMISSQLAGMAWFDSVRRNPVQTQVLRLMVGNGFSPVLARQLVQRLPADCTEAQAMPWLLDVLARNLHCADAQAIGEQGGVFALVGATGIGKTTTTAKIAANFAMKHGAASVGLITADTYRMGASDQLRAFGRILNIPVHTAQDGASLGELLSLLERKKLVLIDTVGMSQRDARLSESTALLQAGRVERVLVLNAGAQGESLDESVRAWGAAPGTRCIITKLDEAARCGAPLDVVIRHRLVLQGFANGQRVPEDWHAPRARLLIQKALLRQPPSVFTQDDGELGLMMTAPGLPAAPAAGARHA